MLQQWIVGLIVLLAAVYALWYWMPAKLRKRLAGAHPKLAESPACGSCSSCGGCSSTAQASHPEKVASGREPIWMAPRR